MQNHLNIILYYLFKYPVLTIITAIFFLISLLILFGIICILLLDKIYRPNIPQYPFNFFLDKFIPLVNMLTPSIIILGFKPFETWFPRLGLLIIIHIFILVPLFHFWSKLRRWDILDNSTSYESWNHPRLYKHISIAIIYPLLWGLYFSLSRFLRLGTTYHVLEFIENLPKDIILIPFIMPHLILWLLIPLSFLSYLRKYLWAELSTLIYSIHIYFLKYYTYFKSMEFLYKSAFFFHNLLTLTIKHDDEIYWWHKLINQLYYKPKYFTFFMLFCILFEIYLTNNVYYGIYILFIYPLIYGLFSCYFQYLNTDFVFDCCFSDYCHQRDNFKSLRYPFKFWNYFKDAEYYFGHEYTFTPKQADEIKIEMNKPNAQWLLRKKISYDVHQDRLNLRVLARKNSSFCLRLTASYLQANRVRWVHTQRLLNPVYKFHSCTSLYTKTLFDKIVLLNNNWGNMNHIQAARVVTPHVSRIYKPFNQTFSYNKKDFIGIQEENIPSNFAELIDKGVVVEPFDKAKASHIPVHFPQASPDTLFIFKASNFIDKRVHALDQKTNNPGIGGNKILSEITPERYKSTIDRYQKHISGYYPLTKDMLYALEQLKTTCNDIIQHQIVWASNLHLFPNNNIPPLKIPENFTYAQFNPEALREIKRSEYRMKRVSDFLWAKKIPQVNHGTFPKEALDLFENSEMQKILAENFPY